MNKPIPMSEEEAQKLYGRMVELQERARELDEHLRGVQEQLRALNQTKEAIAHLEKLPTEKETWIPIAPGAYVRGTIKPATSVLLSVGSQVAVEKDPAAVAETLGRHEELLSGVGDQAISELKDVLSEMDTIRDQVSDAAPPAKDDSSS